MKPHKNPLTAERQTLLPVDSSDIATPTVLVRPKRIAARELRDMRRAKSAFDAIRGLNRELEIVGFTKGQFSLIDLIQACAAVTGPAAMTLSTWTANGGEIATLAEMVARGKLLSGRFLIDASFARRDPQAANALKERFGLNRVRVSQCHAKFMLLDNAEWKLVLRTSMNLNMNPRFEDFTVAHDPELLAFTDGILAELWSRQREGITMAPGDRSNVGRIFSEF